MLRMIMMARYYQSYQHIENRELVYKAFKWEKTLPKVISMCKILIYSLPYYISLILVTNIKRNLELVCVLLALLPFVILYRRCRTMMNPFYPNKVEKFIERNIRRYFVTPKGNALNKEDFRQIKKQNPGLYLEITSDDCEGYCYSYARDIALLFPDSKLIYGAATDPFKKDHIFAHVVLARNGEIYDTNRRMSYKREDYETIYKLQIYRIWTYEEFSKENFSKEVSEEFKKWCQENNVEYHKS